MGKLIFAKEKRANNNLDVMSIIVILIVVLTNLSQMPILIENEIGRSISMIGWGGLLVIILIKRLISFDSRVTFLLVLIWVFLIFVLLNEIIYPGRYLNSLHVYPFLLSMFILLTGFWISKQIRVESLMPILWTYVLTTLIVAISVYLDFFYGSFNWDSRTYNYQSKNSISQIILTSLVFLIVVLKPKKILVRLFKYVTVIFFIILLLMLKSRASILGIPIMIMVMLLFDKSSKLKYFFMITIVIFFILLGINDSFNTLILNDILLAGRRSSNLNDLTSGRYSHFTSFPQLFTENPIIGRGSYWLESFPLSVLVQFGILGALPLLIIAVYPVIWGLLKLNKLSEINISFICLSFIYLFNGLFEALAPFGPGVKNYMLWLMFGILLGRNNKEFNKKSDSKKW